MAEGNWDCLEETVFAVVGGESVHGVAVGDAGRRGCGGITEPHKGTRGHVSEKMEGVRLVFRLGHIFGPEVSQKRGRSHESQSSGNGGERRFRRQHGYILALGKQRHGGGGDHTTTSRGVCTRAEDESLGNRDIWELREIRPWALAVASRRA